MVVATTALASMLAAACAGDGNGPRTDENAVIVTTTTLPAVPEPSTTSPAGPADESSSDLPADPPSSTGPSSTDPPPATVPASVPPATSPPATPPATPPAVGNPSVRAEPIGVFAQPIDLVPRPGTTALYVVEQHGRVTVVDGDETSVAIDVSGRVDDGNEQGLLGLAFSPGGDTVYLDFTDRSGDTVVAEFTVRDDGSFDPATERKIITVEQPYANHNAGDLATGPDGLLYITLGDGGSGGDPLRHASDPTTLLGSILRIDPTPSGDRPYTIPPDNPFADGATVDGVAGAPEVFAWGLRNPWKIAFDPVTGDLWIADVGQDEHEEIDVVGPAGGRVAGWGHDFGWSAFEGTARYNADVPDSGRTTPPVLTYPHRDGACSISGGVPYRGTDIPELEPAYVYSDFCTGTIWALDLTGGRNLVLLEGFEWVTAIRADGEGELYVLEAGGDVSRLVPG